MNSKDLVDLLKNQNIDFFAGVPCSILKNIIEVILKDESVTYVPVVREEEAIGVATGAHLCGRRPAVLMQNAGLANSMGSLATLVLLYRIPMLLLVSWRGYLGRDAPEHRIIGASTTKLLRSLGLRSFTMRKDREEKAVFRALEIIEEKHLPAAVLVKEGILDE